MSLKLMNEAWETDFKGNDKLVLLALADNASDEGYCFPSWTTIQKKTGVARGTLSYILRAFEHFEILKITHRHRENGSNASNEYIVTILDIDLKDYKAFKAEISKKKDDQSSENELAPTVQEMNYPSSENELAPSSENELTIEPSQYEPSIESKEKKKKEKFGNKSEKKLSKIDQLLEELQDENLNDSETKILQAFYKYRSTKLKKPIKTSPPLKAFLRELRKIHNAGFDIKAALELMREKEWQTLELEYVKNCLGSKAIATLAATQKTFYAATQEQKQIKQSSTLANIARVRELREKGQI